VESDPVAGFDVGEARLLVEQQNQLRALAELEADGAAACGTSGEFQELGGEDGAERRWRAGHG
jgi:hypothetical protein